MTGLRTLVLQKGNIHRIDVGTRTDRIEYEASSHLTPYTLQLTPLNLLRRRLEPRRGYPDTRLFRGTTSRLKQAGKPVP